jgi:hypothetical protein
MEFVVVSYRGERDVYVDGMKTGKTNRKLMLAKGVHQVDLGSPNNYAPLKVNISPSDTTPATPLVVEFAAAGYKPAPIAQRSYAFVAMNYSSRLISRFHNGIMPAASAAEMVAIRTDQVPFTGNVVIELFDQIKNCRLLIADLFPENANVHIEVGYAMALDKQIVLLANNQSKRRLNPNKLPFDIRQLRYVEYKKNDDLRYSLQDFLTGLSRQLPRGGPSE